MGVIKQGILGGFQNAVGAVVGSSWKGISVIKAKPVSVANPRTAAQVAQRDSMRYIVAITQPILAAFIKPLWDRFASKMSGYNDFVSTNIAQFVTEWPIMPQNLIFSKGKMAKTEQDTPVSHNNSGEVTMSWVNDAGDGLKLASDVAFAVARNRRTKEISATFTAATRADEAIVVSFNNNVVTGDHLDCYLAFRRADGTVVSGSSWFEGIVVA